MHIAICDDNVGDRKQMERLMQRESERRTAATGVLYIDSYGSAESLLNNPLRYDAYYIDICKSGEYDGTKTAETLLKDGVVSSIILCCSDIDYRKHNFPANVSFLEKPVRQADLSLTVDHALNMKSQVKPQIELRHEKETVYVTEEDILYAVEEKRCLIINLTDGRKIPVIGSAGTFFSQVENYPSFFAPGTRLVLNGRYIDQIIGNKIVMCDHTEYKISRKFLDYAKYTFTEFHEKTAD